MQFKGDIRYININDLYHKPDRQRAKIDDKEMDELVKSIATNGLINPITVYIPPDGVAPYEIMAGVRRYSACRELGYEDMPCRVYNWRLSDIEKRAIELEENLSRVNLTDLERDVAIGDLHDALEAIAHAKGETHRQIDTAIAIGMSQSTVSSAKRNRDDLKRVYGDNPSAGLSAMKSSVFRREVSRRDAMLDNAEAAAKAQIARRKLTEAKPKPATTPQSTPAPSTPPREPSEDDLRRLKKMFDVIDSYVIGDFFDNDLDDGQFALIECDPPYGINLPELRDTDYKGDFLDYREIEEKVYPEFMRRLCEELYRLATNAAYVVLWHSLTFKQLVNDELERAGFSVRKHQVGIWQKGNVPGQQFQPDINLGNSCEFFTYASKGNAKLQPTRKGRSCVFNYARVPSAKKRHMTERPIEMMNEILDTFGSPGGQVLVPFAGSGVTLISASLRNMPAIGYDLFENNKKGFVRHLSEMPEFSQLTLNLK